MRAVLRVLAGLAAAVVGILLLVANDQWAELVVPAAPWSARPRLVTLEVRVWVLVLAAFAAGAVAGVLVVRRRRRKRTLEEAWSSDRPEPRG